MKERNLILEEIRAILDSQGNIKSTHDFEPFGVELQPLSDESTNFKYKYTGQERDNSTNLDYMHARFYGSSIGRFLRPDPINGKPTNPESWNLYAYVGNNPINLTDPTGMFCLTPSTINYVMSIFGGLNGIGGETSTSQTDAGGGGGAPASSNDVSLNVPVYYDAAMNMTFKDMVQDFANLASTFKSDIDEWKLLGIYISLYYSGTADVSLSFTKKNEVQVEVSSTEAEKGIESGSLVIVRTNNKYFKDASFAYLTDKKTGAIFLSSFATSDDLIHEGQHAFGWQPENKISNLVQHLIPDFVRMHMWPWPDIFRGYARGYSNAR